MRENRGSARQRGYTPRWDKAATTFKTRHPYCLGCQAIGERRATEVVDHVEPHKGDQAKFWNTSMWQPACRHCHDVIKKMLERLFEAGECKLADLWLNSPLAISLRRRHRPIERIGTDGWPAQGGASSL